VLGLPPAFAQSQDQTLKFEILIQLDHYISLTSPKHTIVSAFTEAIDWLELIET
jgi:hypothetical protein